MVAKKEASPFDAMAFGPIGTAIKAAMPYTEADPVGVLASTLAIYSAALNGYATPPNGMPIVVWTVLVGRSRVGRKGYALATAEKILGDSLDLFMKHHREQGVSSGPALVALLASREAEAALQEGGPDGRAFIVDEEWPSSLRTTNRCPKYGPFLRTAWDGKPLANTTKGKGSGGAAKVDTHSVPHPKLGFHAHIQPGLWAKFIKADDALGGSYNRILPVEVKCSKLLDDDNPLHNIKTTPSLRKGYEWAKKTRPQLTWHPAAREYYREFRLQHEEMLGETPEHLSCYFERADAQIMRVASVLTVAGSKSVITLPAVKAARAFVEYSMKTVRALVSETPSVMGRPALTLEEKITNILTLRGELRATELYRSLGSRYPATIIEDTVDGMPNVEMEILQSSRPGLKPTVYRLVAEEEEPVPEGEPVVPRPRNTAPRKPRVSAKTAKGSSTRKAK